MEGCEPTLDPGLYLTWIVSSSLSKRFCSSCTVACSFPISSSSRDTASWGTSSESGPTFFIFLFLYGTGF